MNISARKSKRLLAVLGGLDLVSGIVVVVMAARIASGMDIEHPGVVRALGAALMAVGVSGLWFSQRQPPALNRGLQIQAVANAVFAVACLVALLGGPDTVGVIVLVVVAVVVLAVAAWEARLAKKAHR